MTRAPEANTKSAEPLLQELKPELLWINMGCRREGEARRLLDRVATLF